MDNIGISKKTESDREICKNEGITLVVLIITIIVLGIIVSIIIHYGSESINEAKLQNIKTNMLLVEAKAKQYVENANYDLGIKPQEATDEMKAKSNSELEGEGKGTKVTSSSSIFQRLTSIGISNEQINNGCVFQLSTSDLDAMGIKNVDSDDENGWYIIVYDVANASAKIYNTMGIKINKDQVEYCLDNIRNVD